MKRILITGGAGFIGHHMIDYFLQKTDHELIILDRLDMSGNLNRLTDLDSFKEKSERVSFIWHDLKASINDQVAKAIGQVDDVIHLAASSHVDRSIEDPVSFAMDNVVGTTNLLDWARKGGMKTDKEGWHYLLSKDSKHADQEPKEQIRRELIDLEDNTGMIIKVDNDMALVSKYNGTEKYLGKFINFSTDEVFGPAEVGHDHKENEQHLPSNPYSASKSGQGAMGYAFYITYGLPVITTYTMNNFGERQHPEKLIPKAIQSIIEQKEMPIFAEVENGETKAVGSRFWLHSWNTASAIDFILNNGVVGESYNIVGFDELTNLEVCEKISEILGKPLIPKFVDFHKTRPGHDRRYSLDGTKLAELGWKPELSFEEGMKKVVEFTVANKKWQ